MQNTLDGFLILLFADIKPRLGMTHHENHTYQKNDKKYSISFHEPQLWQSISLDAQILAPHRMN
ncbi:MAG: hypothetical protein HC772_11445 [Leptolyngbyaceae cyanobacterium CRU_2_3]|nr:hypothetical protein [Leptolyngbyaceae cyanobacterium CRU_2_3]